MHQGSAAEDGVPMAARRANGDGAADIEAGTPQVAPSGVVAEEVKAAAPLPVFLECDIQSFHPPGRTPPEILKDVQASFPPRTLTAMLGQSGSGKTTLLNILSGRGGGTFRGTLQLNGRSFGFKELKHFANLVPQDDIMYDILSPRETLLFYTKLRLPAQPAAKTHARVEALMTRLGLAYAADVPIGNALRPGISGGQRKRLSIGMELIDNPALLFLDEPTSGLDSRNQEEVVVFLRELANEGCTVVTTIHSPSTGVYCQFDSVLLLVRNIGIGTGSVAFQGTVAEQLAYFASLGAPLPPFANPAEHALTCLDADYAPLSLPALWRLRRLHLLYQTLPDLSGATATVVMERLQRLLHLAAHCMRAEGDELAPAEPPADLAAFAAAVAEGGGAYLSFAHAMLACALAAEPSAATSGALEALGLPRAAAAPAAVARLSDVARRMEACHAFTQLHAAYAAAVARRMDLAPPPASRASPATQQAADAAAGASAGPKPLSAADKASARAADQALRLKRAFDTGGWSWRLPAADAVDMLRELGYERAMALAPQQTVALVDALALGGAVAFGELSTALFLHAHPVLPGAANASADDICAGGNAAAEALLAAAAAAPERDATRRLLRVAFPEGLRLDGQQLTDAQVAAYARFLDADGDGAASAPDVARWLRGCTALRALLQAPAPQRAPAEMEHDIGLGASRPAYANSGWTQWWLLLRREFQMLAHDRRQLVTIAAMTVLIPLFLGGMYWQIEQTQKNFTNLVAALFLSCLFSGILPLNTTMMAFPSEQVIVKREYSNGCYSSAAYYGAKSMFLSLARGGQSLVVAMLIYFMAGLYPRPITFENVLIFFFSLVIVVVWSSCAGLMFGIVVPDAASAAAVSMPFVLIQILFSGFYLTKAGIPPWFIWAYYISFFRYALAIVVKNLFHKLRFKPCSGFFCPFGVQGSGQDVERQYGVQNDSMAMLFGVCVGYTVLIIIIGYCALVLQLRSQLRRKAPPHHAPAQSAAARVLGLPEYALAFAAKGKQPLTPAGSERLEVGRLRRFLRKRGARAAR